MSSQLVNESHKRGCKLCGAVKQRIFAFKAGRHKLWKDESGAFWSGRVCGSCTDHRIKLAMRAKRALNKEYDRSKSSVRSKKKRS